MFFLGNYFYFARHGETAYNACGVVTGTCDIPLNDAGAEQARSVAPLVRSLGLTACYVSPLIRAIHTAELMLDETNVPITKLGMLYERHWGQLEGTSKAELDMYDFAENQVEPWGTFCTRTIASLESLSVTVPVLIVAHSGTFRALCEYLKVTIEKAPVKNVCPYRFRKEGGVWKVNALDE